MSWLKHKSKENIIQFRQLRSHWFSIILFFLFCSCLSKELIDQTYTRCISAVARWNKLRKFNAVMPEDHSEMLMERLRTYLSTNEIQKKIILNVVYPESDNNFQENVTISSWVVGLQAMKFRTTLGRSKLPTSNCFENSYPSYIDNAPLLLHFITIKHIVPSYRFRGVDFQS